MRPKFHLLTLKIQNKEVGFTSNSLQYKKTNLGLKITV